MPKIIPLEEKIERLEKELEEVKTSYKSKLSEERAEIRRLKSQLRYHSDRNYVCALNFAKYKNVIDSLNQQLYEQRIKNEDLEKKLKEEYCGACYIHPCTDKEMNPSEIASQLYYFQIGETSFEKFADDYYKTDYFDHCDLIINIHPRYGGVLTKEARKKIIDYLNSHKSYHSMYERGLEELQNYPDKRSINFEEWGFNKGRSIFTLYASVFYWDNSLGLC